VGDFNPLYGSAMADANVSCGDLDRRNLLRSRLGRGVPGEEMSDISHRINLRLKTLRRFETPIFDRGSAPHNAKVNLENGKEMEWKEGWKDGRLG